MYYILNLCNHDLEIILEMRVEILTNFSLHFFQSYNADYFLSAKHYKNFPQCN